MKKSIIILASGDIRDKLHYIKYDCGSPALIPINTKPLASYVIDFYLNEGDCDVFLIVHKDFVELVKIEMGNYKDKVSVISIDKTSGIIESLSYALKDKRISNDVIVNIVTTIPTKMPSFNQIFVGKESDFSINCSFVDFQNNKLELIPKSFNVNLKKGFPFVGIFRINKDFLIDACLKVKNKTDLILVVKKIVETQKITVESIDWIDCGHETNYYEAKKKLISSRSFNNIEINKKGVLFKKSSNIKKIKEELSYFQLLPKELAIYFPRIFDKNIVKESKVGYSMEYYGYPNVSELLLYWNLSNSSWNKLFKQLENILIDFSNYKSHIGKEAFIDFYYLKLIDRITTYSLQSSENMHLIKNDCTINGLFCKKFDDIKDDLLKIISRLYNKERFSIMHGDFCFNNILFDYTSGIVKLIDVRGSFGNNCIGIYGDPLYDLAKLAHSAYGKYDYLVNNLYSLIQNDNRFTLCFSLRTNSEIVENLCKELIVRCGFDLNIVDIIMSTLFLSMTPLHNDDKQKQKAIYLHGLYLLNKGLKNENLY